MGRYHPDLDDWAEDAPANREDVKASYNPFEKIAIVGWLETITVGVLIAASRTKFVRELGRERRLTPRQTNAVMAIGFTLPWALIVFQRAYYDTLINWRNVDRREGAGEPFGLGHDVDLAWWKRRPLPESQGKEEEIKKTQRN